MFMNLFDILFLYRIKHIGPVGFKFLINHINTLDQIYEYIKEVGIKWNGKKIVLPDKQDIENEISNTHNNGAKFITYLDPKYPKILNQYHAPPVFTYKGNIDLLTNKPILAVIGTRIPSREGVEFCKSIINQIGHYFNISSGFASGIDYEAHKSSLLTGTIAVLPCGINYIYPNNHNIIYDELSKHGLLITDLPFNTYPQKFFLLKRNKLLVMISNATLVIESTKNSGTMHTAYETQKANKKLFVVPGHPTNIKYTGNHELIRNGANIVLCADDILSQNLSLYETKEEFFYEFAEIKKQEIYQYIQKCKSLSLDDLFQQFGRNILYSVLAELEIANVISITDNNINCI